jgi:hypothetical protein
VRAAIVAVSAKEGSLADRSKLEGEDWGNHGGQVPRKNQAGMWDWAVVIAGVADGVP